MEIPIFRFERERIYYFAVKAIDAAGNKSIFSEEVPFFITTGIKDDEYLERYTKIKLFNIRGRNLGEYDKIDWEKLASGTYIKTYWEKSKMVKSELLIIIK